MFRKRHKKGEIFPVDDISLDDVLKIQLKDCNCKRSYIMERPLGVIEYEGYAWYDEFKYVCMGCGWESPKFRKRTA